MLLVCCLTVAGQNPFNGNFEIIRNGVPQGWDLTYKNQNKYIVKLDSAISRQGRFSVSMEATSAERSGAIIYPIEERFEGKSLILIGSLKTTDVADGFAGLWIRTADAYGKTISYENMEEQTLIGTNDWKEYMIQVPYDGQEVANIDIGAVLAGKGKIWVDSIRLYVDEKPISEARLMKAPFYKALADRELDANSGIDTVPVSKSNLKYLALLGELWGFLKYHHPAIANGDYNWDSELFRILPSVIVCDNDKDFSRMMENWVDKLGTNISSEPKKAVLNDSVLVNPEYGTIFKNKVFSKILVTKLNYIKDYCRNTHNFYVGDLVNADHSSFKHERKYDSKSYPDAGQRLLAVYRYWSMIQYFNPNKHLLSKRWDSVLPVFVSEIAQASNAHAYVNTMVKMISCINDSHAFIQSTIYEQSLGKYRLPVKGQFIQGKVVITSNVVDSLNRSRNLITGDIIISINGKKTSELINQYLPLTPASNRAAALRDMISTYLFRSKDSTFILDVLRNKKHTKLIINGLETSNTYAYLPIASQKQPYRLINPSIGYIYCGGYKNTDLDSIKLKFKGTKGIIVDMRGYPVDEMASTLAAYFKAQPGIFIKFSKRSITRPGLFVAMPGDQIGSRSADNYKGKVVVLVNELTQSNAEFVAMAIQSGNNTTTIGSSSAGANGNITPIDLPGGIRTWMSGLGVYYPDGTNAQRTGVKVDQIVRPTIQGLKTGEDEILKVAISDITTSIK
jgi:C-terminal processing protease CtpA/Prc